MSKEKPQQPQQPQPSKPHTDDQPKPIKHSPEHIEPSKPWPRPPKK